MYHAVFDTPLRLMQRHMRARQQTQLQVTAHLYLHVQLLGLRIFELRITAPIEFVSSHGSET